MNLQLQSGYVVLAMLVLLMSVGGAWLGMLGLPKSARYIDETLSFHDRQSLVDTRQALLSYATLYPFLYGPSGAGPGHLPCPDSDGFHRGLAPPESGFHQRRDGPDPPCIALPVSAGMMPRHVKLPGLHYVFHTQVTQNFLYEVDGALINNPLNRLVNSSVLRQPDSVPAAVVSLPSVNGTSMLGRVELSRSAILGTTVAAVAAWIIARSRETRPGSCDSDEQVDVLGVVQVTPCDKSLTPATDCESEHLLELLLDVSVAVDTCLIANVKDHTIEGVPAERHWFLRNEWLSFVALDYAKGCEPGLHGISLCKLIYPPESRQAVKRGGTRLTLRWVLAE